MLTGQTKIQGQSLSCQAELGPSFSIQLIFMAMQAKRVGYMNACSEYIELQRRG